jgi:CO/xanthine dehydrogenase Mo-binding subunit
MTATALLRGARPIRGRRRVTAADVPDARIPMRLQFAETPESTRALQPLLARDRVRYVGEPVAVVVAEDAYVAEDAAELVALDLDELPAVATVEEE